MGERVKCGMPGRFWPGVAGGVPRGQRHERCRPSARNPKAYVVSGGLNALRNFLRCECRRRSTDTFSLDSIAAADETNAGEVAPGERTPAPDVHLETADTREAVRRAVAGLPEKERRAVEVLYFAGKRHTTRTAAVALGVSRGTVSDRHRAPYRIGAAVAHCAHAVSLPFCELCHTCFVARLHQLAGLDLRSPAAYDPCGRSKRRALRGCMFLKRLYWTAYVMYHHRGEGRYPFKPLPAIRRAQRRRVRKIVAHAYRHVAYYRETMERVGLTPSDFRTAEDLAKLPVLERGSLQSDPEYFTARGTRLDGCLCRRSSGSTGTPVRVYDDTRSLFRNTACGGRGRAVFASLFGQQSRRETLIAVPEGASAQAHDFVLRNTLFATLRLMQAQALSCFDPPEKNVPLMNAFQPDVLNTFGSYLELLFPYLRASGAPFHRPRLVRYGGDGLSRAVRRLIEDEFGIPVFSSYQSIEAPRISFECEQHEGLHVNIDLYPVRIVDAEGKNLPPGETGEVVVSNLVNRVSVLLNYRQGDVAALLPGPCPCGRSLPLMSFPQGRSDDCIVLPSGRRLHAQCAIECIELEEEIWQFQIVQDAPARLRAAVVAAPGCDRQAIQRRVQERAARVIGESVALEVHFVDSLDRTTGGKLRTVISLLPDDHPHAADAHGAEDHPLGRRAAPSPPEHR